MNNENVVASPCLASNDSFSGKVIRDEQRRVDDAHVVFRDAPRQGKFTDLIDLLLSRKFTFDKETAQNLCQSAQELLADEPSMIDIVVGDEEELVVVGDIHGQFDDLVTHVLSQEFRRDGGKQKRFLFLGDYVDRGPQGVEVIMLLLALKVEFPDRIFLLRGNHEDSQTSRIYGFLNEVRNKFGDANEWASFNMVFCFLPLAANVSSTTSQRKFLAMHGGLSPQLEDPSVINDFIRSDYGGMLDNESADIVDGLLWSDPSDATTRFQGNERGCGYIFGPTATREFCEQNGIDFICRAHQMTMPGYCWTHDNLCLTVFSAPNYCGMSGNMGAIMVFDGSAPSFVQFDSAEPHEADEPPRNGNGAISQYFGN